MDLTLPLHRAMACRPNAIATVLVDRRHTFTQFGDRVAWFAGGAWAAETLRK
jgi:hypothetical protein